MPVGESRVIGVTDAPLVAHRRPLWKRGLALDLAADRELRGGGVLGDLPDLAAPDLGAGGQPGGPGFFEWMLGHGALVATGQASPFFSEAMNAPLGINLMANTSVLGISIPLTPVTLLFGPHVAFNVFLTGGLILTAVSWYLVLSRYLLRRRFGGLGRCRLPRVRAWDDLPGQRAPQPGRAVPRCRC